MASVRKNAIAKILDLHNCQDICPASNAVQPGAASLCPPAMYQTPSSSTQSVSLGGTHTTLPAQLAMPAMNQQASVTPSLPSTMGNNRKELRWYSLFIP